MADIQTTFANAMWAALRQQSADASQKKRNDGRFAADFFHQWFTQFGTAHFFLFKKNLKVTNIQFAELLALVQTEIYDSDGGVVPDLLFVSPDEFDGTIRETAGALRDLSADQFVESVSTLYAKLLERTVVIRSFFTSAVVFLPSHLNLHLAAVAGHAGYVHSCGPAAYVRRMDKATPEEFTNAVRRTAAALPPGRKIMFAPFSHEDHTKHDRQWEDDLRAA